MPPAETRKELRTWAVLRDYTRASFQYPWSLSLVITATLAAQGVSIIVPLFLKRLLDLLSKNAPSPVVLNALFAVIAVYGALGVINWASRRLLFRGVNKIESSVMADLANKAFEYLLGHGIDFFTSNFVGTLTRRVTRYSRSFEQVFDIVMFNLLPAFLYAMGSIVILFRRSHWLGIVIFLWVVTFIGVQFLLARWRAPQRALRVAEDSRMTGVLSDAINNYNAVKLFASETYERDIFANVVESWRTATVRTWESDNVVQGIQQGLGVFIEIALLVIAILLWNRGITTVGDFILIQVYILNLIDMIWNIGRQFQRLTDAFADASEMIVIMEQPHEIKDAPDALSLKNVRGEIVFNNVRFYFSEERPLLENYSLEIAAGEKIALVGSSGAGKSTITKLLLRLYDVKEGSIQIDGQDIRNVTQESLREAISFVPQEPVLFHRTLRENIAYGRRDASEAEIIEAAKRAHCHEFITALPQGYDTLVGERGIKLSGGERQRVAIARAILKNAPILVLDEATSSLDSESEALIQDALAKLMEGKTVIAIAHRLSTIMKMDRIIVMEHGKVTLSGTHGELLAQESNLYKKLWSIQAGGFIDDQNKV